MYTVLLVAILVYVAWALAVHSHVLAACRWLVRVELHVRLLRLPVQVLSVRLLSILHWLARCVVLDTWRVWLRHLNVVHNWRAVMSCVDLANTYWCLVHVRRLGWARNQFTHKRSLRQLVISLAFVDISLRCNCIHFLLAKWSWLLSSFEFSFWSYSVWIYLSHKLSLCSFKISMLL